jgi:biotin carboxylase
LLVLPATSYRGEAYVQASERLGVELTLGSDAASAMRRHGRPVLELDLARPEEAAQNVLARGGRFDGVLGTDEQTALVAAHVAAALGLPSSDPDAALAARDKRRMRQRLEAAGVPGPRVCVLEPLQGAADLHDAAFPCVVKPPMLSGSQGVIRADDEASLDTAIARVRGILARHPSSWREHPDFHRLLVEDYIDGPEVAVEALMHDGQLELVALFDKPDDLVGPFFEETIYVTPSRLAAETLRRVEIVTARACSAMGLVEGPVHTEVRIEHGVDGDRLHVIEVAARSIGGLCARTLRFGAGIALEELVLRHALGMSLDGLVREPGASGVMMLPIPRAGTLREVGGQDAARAVPGVAGLEITIPRGRQVVPLPEGDRYLGFLFARGDTAEAVEAVLRKANSELVVDIRP